MSIEENKRLVRRYIEEVVNAGEVDRIPEFISPDYVEVHDNARHPSGTEGAKEHIRGVRTTYPDLRLTVEQQIAEGEWEKGVHNILVMKTQGGEYLAMKPYGLCSVYCR